MGIAERVFWDWGRFGASGKVGVAWSWSGDVEAAGGVQWIVQAGRVESTVMKQPWFSFSPICWLCSCERSQLKSARWSYSCDFQN